MALHACARPFFCVTLSAVTISSWRNLKFFTISILRKYIIPWMS